MNEFMYTVVAIAGGGGAGAGGGQDLIMGFIVPMALVFGIMYFLIIRPQQKKQKEHEDYVNNLKSGDKVVTQGGLFGRVTAVSEKYVTLELGDRVRVKVLRSHVAGTQGSALEGDDKSSKSEEAESESKKSKKKKS